MRFNTREKRPYRESWKSRWETGFEGDAGGEDSGEREKMGKKEFKEFIRKQDATQAYKQAIVTASSSLQQFGHPAAFRTRPQSALSTFQSSMNGSVISDDTRSDHSDRSRQSSRRRPESSLSTSGRRFGGFSRGFEERSQLAVQSYLMKKTGFVPRTKYERENQSGTCMSPLLDEAHPMYNRREYRHERRQIVGLSTPQVTWREIEDFATRQMECAKQKEETVLRIQQETLERVRLSHLSHTSTRERTHTFASLHTPFFASTAQEWTTLPKLFPHKNKIK